MRSNTKYHLKFVFLFIIFLFGIIAKIQPQSGLSYKVHLFYYPWYGNPETDGSWIHWTQNGRIPPNDIASNFYPQLGAYSSNNDAIINQHMQWIAQAKIGVISVSWWGQGSREDQLIPKILNAANTFGIKVCWHLEPYGGSTAQSTVNDINYINQKYGSHPAFYRAAEFGNKPVFYIFNSLRIADWSPLTTVNQNNIILTQTTDQSKATYFGGMYNYSAPTTSDIVGVWQSMSNFCKSQGKVWSPSIGPGYVDTRIGGSLDFNRQNGQLYDNNWDWAIASTPGFISITSFNEWHEGSQIEPAAYNPPTPNGQAYYTYNGAYGLTGAASNLAYVNKTSQRVAAWDQSITSVPVTGITVSPTSVTMNVGGTQQLAPSIQPTNATNKNVTYSSSNTNVTTVNSSGIITAIGAGNATITVTTADLGRTATCAVTVVEISLPSPWSSSDIGAVATLGNANYSNGTFSVSGSGADIWDAADEFRFVYQQVSGDVTITARVTSLTNTNSWAKAGVMIRNGLGANVSHAFTAATISNGLAFQTRLTAGATSNHLAGPSGSAPYWVRLQRTGNTFTSFVSINGTTWVQIGSQTITMASQVYVGLAVTSHNDGTLCTSAFDNVTIVKTDCIPVTGVSVNPTSTVLKVGQTIQLTYTVYSGCGTAPNAMVTYSSSNTTVATVTSGGLVTGIATGSAVITVRTADGGLTATCNVTVVQPVTGVTVSPTTTSLSAGQTLQLTATVSPSNATNKSVYWTSSNTAIATVSANGVVTGIGSGTAVITVTTNDGGYTATCTIAPLICVTSGVIINPTSISIYVGQTYQLTTTLLSDCSGGPTNKNVTWSSSNAAVVTVSSTGLISGNAQGTATITATSVDQGKTGTCTVTVSQQPTTTSYRIKNRWQNTYLYDAGDRVRYSATPSGTSYQWVLEDVGSGSKEIKNVSTGEYMHIENLTSFVQCTARTSGWMSSRWTTEDAGSGFVRFKNVWQPSYYMHVENLQNQLQYSTINSSWWSAMWLLEPVSQTITETPSEKVSSNEYNLFPNPVSNGKAKLLIPNNDEKVTYIQIIDLQGKTRLENTIHSVETDLDLSSLSKGIYLVKVCNGNNQSILKLMIQ